MCKRLSIAGPRWASGHCKFMCVRACVRASVRACVRARGCDDSGKGLLSMWTVEVVHPFMGIVSPGGTWVREIVGIGLSAKQISLRSKYCRPTTV